MAWTSSKAMELSFKLKLIKKTKLNAADAKVHFYQMVSASFHQQDQGDGLKICSCFYLHDFHTYIAKCVR